MTSNIVVVRGGTHGVSSSSFPLVLHVNQIATALPTDVLHISTPQPHCSTFSRFVAAVLAVDGCRSMYVTSLSKIRMREVGRADGDAHLRLMIRHGDILKGEEAWVRCANPCRHVLSTASSISPSPVRSRIEYPRPLGCRCCERLFRYIQPAGLPGIQLGEGTPLQQVSTGLDPVRMAPTWVHHHAKHYHLPYLEVQYGLASMLSGVLSLGRDILCSASR